MKILVTGSNGQVGSALVGLLSVRDDVELLAVDRDELDITDQKAVDSLVSNFEPDFIINAAAHTAVDKAEQEVALSYAINELGPKYLAQAANRINSTILHISTDYVFPGDKDGEYFEDDETGPLSVYGKSKLAGEIALSEVNDKHIILRTAWVFGEGGNNFVKTMLRLARDRDALSIVGDQFGGPTYAGDIASALVEVTEQLYKTADSSRYGVYHYSGLPYKSWFEFAQSIFNYAERASILTAPQLSSIKTEMYPTPAPRPENSKMNCSKIKRTFGIEPSDWLRALTNIEAYRD